MGVFSTFVCVGIGDGSFSYRSSDRQVLISSFVVELRPSYKRRTLTEELPMFASFSSFDASHASFSFGRKSCFHGGGVIKSVAAHGYVREY